MTELERSSGDIIPAGYVELLDTLKTRIRTAQTRAALAANRELIQLYWEIGKEIIERQQAEGWGTAIIERLATDIQRAFPGIAGFSPRNIWRMRAFYLAYRDEELSQVATELPGRTPPVFALALPWFHNVVIVESVKDPIQRCWYAGQALEHGWSRNILAIQIKSNLYARKGKAEATLPPPQSDLAGEALKDPYLFDFLILADAARERELEEKLVTHLARFLLELGAGFAFIGRQVRLDIGGQEYYLDLLFYHTRLHCYVVVELKAGEFRPEDAGKLNFYLSAVDDRMRTSQDQPTIGILLCRGKHRLVVEYALRGLARPIGVADWHAQFVSTLPADLCPTLPTVEEFEAQIDALTDEITGGNGDE
jgi:predicted nuclease of restriction endonuclease-like (RecB) superfamily